MCEVETLTKQLAHCNIRREAMYYRKTERSNGLSLTCKLLVYDTTSVTDTAVEDFDLVSVYYHIKKIIMEHILTFH